MSACFRWISPRFELGGLIAAALRELQNETPVGRADRGLVVLTDRRRGTGVLEDVVRIQVPSA